MFRNKIAIIFLIISFASCNKEELILSNFDKKYNVSKDCIDTTLIPPSNIPNSQDLTRYIIRNLMTIAMQ